MGVFELYTSKRNSRFLTPNERIKIELWHKEGYSQSEIARRLGVNRSSICRELKKGDCEQLNGSTWETYHIYSAEIAQKKHDYAQTSKGADLKIGNRFDYLKAIEDRVLDNHSLEEAILYVAQTMQFDIAITKQTAYRYLDIGLFPHLKRKDMPSPRKKHHRKIIRRTNSNHADHRSIENRPQDIKNRTSFGHWEIDSIIGKSKGKKESVLTLSERLTRQEIVIRTNGKTAADTVQALLKLRHTLGKDFQNIFQSITCDNGSEFADQQGMEKSGTTLYYCHPQSPGERGTNENSNRILRRKLPKGKSLSRCTPKQAKEVQDWINDIRRPILGGKSSQQVFFEQLDKLSLQNPERVKNFFRFTTRPEPPIVEYSLRAQA